MKLREIKKRLLNFLGLNVLTFIANLAIKTYRFDIRNDEPVKKIAKEGGKFVAAFWHGRMIIPWYIHRNYKVAALVSKSKDGEMLTRMLKSWNYDVVRGSSSSASLFIAIAMTSRSPFTISRRSSRLWKMPALL